MSIPIARLALAAALLLAAAPHAAAQPAPPALPDGGARVRVILVDRARVVGTLVAREPGRWLVAREHGDTVAVAPLQVERLDVSQGLRSPAQAFWRGAGTGFLVGAGIGLGATAATAIAYRDGCGDCFVSPVAVMGVLAVGFTATTTLVGGVVGSLRRERWTRVPLLPPESRVGVAITPHGSGIGVQVPLPR